MKLLLLSHGGFGKGIKESYRMIAGDDSNILDISLDDDGIGSFTDKVENLLNELTLEEKILVLTDIKGGTPFNVAMKYQLENPNRIELISGMNLPMILELGIEIETETDIEKLSLDAIEIGKAGIVRSNDNSYKKNDDDFEI